MFISPFYAILIPILGGGLIALLKEDQDGPRNALAVLIAILTFSIVAPTLPLVLAGEQLTFTAVRISGGLSIAFRVEIGRAHV